MCQAVSVNFTLCSAMNQPTELGFWMTYRPDKADENAALLHLRKVSKLPEELLRSAVSFLTIRSPTKRSSQVRVNA